MILHKSSIVPVSLISRLHYSNLLICVKNAPRLLARKMEDSFKPLSDLIPVLKEFGLHVPEGYTDAKSWGTLNAGYGHFMEHVGSARFLS